MKMTADLSNLVLLWDGVRNNHEIDLSVVDSKRTIALLRSAPQYVYSFKSVPIFQNGRYLYDDAIPQSLWVAIVAYGNFGDGVNSQTINTVEIGAMTMHTRNKDESGIRYKIRERFQSFNPKEECIVFALFSQAEIFKKARSIRKSTIAEIVWDKSLSLFKSMKSRKLS